MRTSGKLAPKHDDRTLMMGNYSISLPAPATAIDNLQRVYTNLKINNPKILFPMDGNDEFGDCTIAGFNHISTVYNGLIGIKKIATKVATVKLYKKLTGGSDTGLVELDVLNYCRKHTVSGTKILAYVKINPKNHIHVKQAIQLFGGVYLGINVQKDAITDFDNNHKIWTPGLLTGDGHAIVAISYDPNTVTVLTWGDVQKGTWDWWDETVDECYAIIPTEAKKSGFTPGFNFDQLMIDLKSVTN
jgi:hypothetical protein